MAKRELTAEELEARKAALAKGRETAARNRALKAQAASDGEPAAPITEPWIDDPAEPDPPRVDTEGFDEFLLTLDAETKAALSMPKLMAIYEAGRAKAEEERIKALEKRAMERALGAARTRNGVVPAKQAEHLAWLRRMGEPVTFTPDLPEIGDVGLRIDGQVLLHGKPITGTRAQYESYRDIAWRARQAELDFEGRSRLSHLRRAMGTSTDLMGNPV